MEGWGNLIQAFDKLDEENRVFITNIFCECLKNSSENSKQDLEKVLKKGNKESLIAMKVLEKLCQVPSFSELFELSVSIDSNIEVYETLIRYHRDQFFQEIVTKLHEFPKKSQENILHTIKLAESPSIPELSILVSSLQSSKKHNEDSLDLIVSLHHQAAAYLLKSNPSLVQSYFELPYFSSNSIQVKELIHYLGILPASFFNQEKIKYLEQGLLHKDLNVRRNSTLLLKNYLKFGSKSEKLDIFWEIYESLENYNKAMISGPWKRIYLLFNWDLAKVTLLFKRGQFHENLTVRRFIAKNYMKQEKVDPEFTETVFLEFLADPGLYSDAVELVGRSRFGEVICNFLVKYVRNSSDMVRTLRNLLVNTFDFVIFQIAFRYFIDAFSQIFDWGTVDCEMIEKATNSIRNQISQLTPYQRHKSLKFLQQIVEVPDSRFLIQKVRLAVKLPFICKVMIDVQEAKALLSNHFEKWSKGEKLDLTWQEAGLLFALSFSNDSMKLCTGLINSVQSVYRSTYQTSDSIKSSVSALTSLLNYINQYQTQNISSYLSICLDEVFSLCFSCQDKDTIKCLCKLIKSILTNSQSNFIPWALSKLSLIIDSINQQNSSLVPLLSLCHSITKSISNQNSTDFPTTFTRLSQTLACLSERKSSAREDLRDLTVLKWKTLSTINKFSNYNIYNLAGDQLDIANQQLIESLFNILSTNLQPSSPDLPNLVSKSWSLVLETKNDAPLSIVSSFARLAFNDATVNLPSTPGLLKQVLLKGQTRWGITRIAVHQLYPVWLRQPDSVINYIDSIFELCYYEEPRSEDTDFLVPCLYALANFPKPHVKGDLQSLRSQTIRVFVLKMIGKIENYEFKLGCFERTVEALRIACEDKGEFPNSLVYKMKVRMGHLLCALADWCCEMCEERVLERNVAVLIEVLKVAYVHSARQYIERFLIVVMIKHPRLVDLVQIDYDMRPQLAGSYILILGSIMYFTPLADLKSTLFSSILPFMISNTAHIRRTSHFVLYKFLSSHPSYNSHSPCFSFLLHNKECLKMMRKLESSLISFESLQKCDLDFILSGSFSDFDEIIHTSLISEIEDQCKYLLDTSYEINYQEHWKQISENLPKIENFSNNFQRKVEDTEALVELRTSKGVQRRHELVVVASLVDKLPNLAGITRTSEVFNLQMVTMAAKNVLNDSEFKSMAVTADKWLPIMEVGKSDLEKFIRIYRQKGYVIIGLEQTAGSVSIEKFQFSSKSVLVLGHEKDGIPSELLGLLDACLEIPQFGLIRSLNVHVSASICIWEYMKQLYLKDSL